MQKRSETEEERPWQKELQKVLDENTQCKTATVEHSRSLRKDYDDENQYEIGRVMPNIDPSDPRYTLMFESTIAGIKARAAGKITW